MIKSLPCKFHAELFIILVSFEKFQEHRIVFWVDNNQNILEILFEY